MMGKILAWFGLCFCEWAWRRSQAAGLVTPGSVTSVLAAGKGVQHMEATLFHLSWF